MRTRDEWPGPSGGAEVAERAMRGRGIIGTGAKKYRNVRGRALHTHRRPRGFNHLSRRLVFESLRSTIDDLLGGRVQPGDRRAVISGMKQALVLAKLGVEDLEQGVMVTRRKLEAERHGLETAARRKGLAARIDDAETVAIAGKFEGQHAERIAVLERKLEAQEAEAALARRDYDEMLVQLKAASSGAGGVGATAGAAGTMRGPTDEELGLPDDAKLRAELDAMRRARSREDKDVEATARLEELKRRMGKQ